MTMPAADPPHHVGHPSLYMERVAAIGVAAAWTQRSRRKHATAGGPAPTDLLTDPQYPQTWDDYIGQENAKNRLRKTVERARARREVVRHILITCTEPGVGKTALAVLVARTIGGRCFAMSGTPTQAEVVKLLCSMRDGDVLFIDEIHRLVVGGKSKAEWLLHLLQDGVVMGPTGVIKRLRITVIGATTDVARLPETVTTRFGPAVELERYTLNEAYFIALEHARVLFPPLPMPSSDDMTGFVLAGDCNPRRIKQLLDLAVDGHYGDDEYDFDTVLREAGMTVDGLDRTGQNYLVTLHQAYGPMGEAQLRSLLSEPSLTHIERRLADKGYIAFTRSGRVLTAEGRERAKALLQGEGGSDG